MARLLLALLCATSLTAAAQAPRGSHEPGLERAHAHNDYQHARPLLDALERGFASIEADVHLVGGELLVAHDRDSVVAGRTLERLYLAPLRALDARAALDGERLRPDGAPLLLLIDIKSDAERTYRALDALLRRYGDVVTGFDGDDLVARPVLAVLSGNRPIATVRAARTRFAALDGRLTDLADSAASPSPAVMPLVSDAWERITKWRGDGPPPPAVHARVASAVARAHARGYRLRFWGTPDRAVVWQLLYDAGVDLIGADDLDALREFLTRQP